MMASVLLSSFHDQLTLVGTQMDKTPSASSIDVQLATSNTMPPASEFTEQASPRLSEGRVVAVRVLQGNHRFVDVVDVVAGRPRAMKFLYRPSGRPQAHPRTARRPPREHGVRDVDV